MTIAAAQREGGAHDGMVNRSGNDDYGDDKWINSRRG